MSNNDIDRAFIELKALSQKKGYLLFDDLERGTDGLSLNEVDWLTNRLLTSGVEIFDDVPDTIKNGPGFKLAKIQEILSERFCFEIQDIKSYWKNGLT